MTKISASIICGNPINLKSDLHSLEKGKIEYIHFDIMDGIFVPRYGLYPEYLSSIKKSTKIPIDVHMMTINPELYIPLLAESGADYISVHAENNHHLHRTIKLIKQHHLKAGLVLNPATPLNTLDYLLTDLDLIVLMGINPGIVGHQLIPSTIEKIKDLKQKLKKTKSSIFVEIDGGVTFNSAPSLTKAGADILVCGSSTIFNQPQPLLSKINEFRQTINE